MALMKGRNKRMLDEIFIKEGIYEICEGLLCEAKRVYTMMIFSGFRGGET